MQMLPSVSGIRRLSQAAAAAPAASSVKPPNRIRRSRTALLQALANTVKHDPESTAFYKLHDDPFMKVLGTQRTMLNTMSKEAGRQVAREIAAEWPTLFMYDRDQPRIDAFRPVKRPTVDEDATEEALVDRMSKGWTSNVLQVYSNMQDEGTELSVEGQQSLLEYLCLHNCAEPSTAESPWPAARWYRNVSAPEDHRRSGQWQPGNMAELVFESMPDKTAAAYSALIAGQCVHGNARQASLLYKQMRHNGLLPTLTAYNQLLAQAHTYTAGTPKDVWDAVLEMLKEMSTEGVEPNVSTLGACTAQLARAASTNPGELKPEEQLSKIVYEFGRIGVSPSLSTYDHTLTVYEHTDKGVYLSDTLTQILDALEKRNFSIAELASESDGELFVHAMSVCLAVKSVPLADRLFALVNAVGANNQLYLNDFVSNERLHALYLQTLAEVAQTDELCRVWANLVPFAYCPDVRVAIKVLDNIDLSGELTYLEAVYPDLVGLHERSAAVLGKLMQMLCLADYKENEAQKGVALRIANDFAARIQQLNRPRRLRSPRTFFPPLSFCHLRLAQVYCNIGELQPARDLVDTFIAFSRQHPPHTPLLQDICFLHLRALVQLLLSLHAPVDECIELLELASQQGGQMARLPEIVQSTAETIERQAPLLSDEQRERIDDCLQRGAQPAADAYD